MPSAPQVSLDVWKFLRQHLNRQGNTLVFLCAETITQQSSERAHKIPVRVEHFPVAPSFHNQYKRQKNEESAQGFIVSAAIVKEG